MTDHPDLKIPFPMSARDSGYQCQPVDWTELLAQEPNRRDSLGNDLFDFGTLSFMDRCAFDLRHCPGPDWRQYDTEQDAWYFGVWVHVSNRWIVTYAEGDLCLVRCADDAAFAAKLAAMEEFYGSPPPAFTVILPDEKKVVKIYDDRPTVEVKDAP
jgi:hypothetical protein